MFIFIYITLLILWVSEVSARYMRHWSFSNEMTMHMIALVVLALVARVMQALYAATNPWYYRHVMRVRKQRSTARYFRTMSSRPLH